MHRFTGLGVHAAFSEAEHPIGATLSRVLDEHDPFLCVVLSVVIDGRGVVLVAFEWSNDIHGRRFRRLENLLVLVCGVDFSAFRSTWSNDFHCLENKEDRGKHCKRSGELHACMDDDRRSRSPDHEVEEQHPNHSSGGAVVPESQSAGVKTPGDEEDYAIHSDDHGLPAEILECSEERSDQIEQFLPHGSLLTVFRQADSGEPSIQRFHCGSNFSSDVAVYASQAIAAYR